MLSHQEADSEMAPDIEAEQNARATRLPRQRYQHRRNMKNQSERLKTFTNWNVRFLDVRKLTENGFYYTNTDDVVKCAFCGVQIGFWEEGDVPEEDHKRLSPNCPRVRGIDPESEGADDSSEEVTSQDVCGSYGFEILPNSAPERPGKTSFAIGSGDLWRDFRNLGVSKISGPVSPCYATYNSRIKTFDNWPIPDIQAPEKLADAGFYYTALDDKVLCFHCGGGLKNWEVDDDPWVEHSRWFNRCGFIILRKGREYVNEILAKQRNELAGEAQQLMESTKTGAQVEEKEAKPEGNRNVPEPTGPETEDKTPKTPDLEEKELELCRICYVRKRKIVFLPCGHLFSCPECASSLSTCAVCRKPFEATVRAYLS